MPLQVATIGSSLSSRACSSWPRQAAAASTPKRILSSKAVRVVVCLIAGPHAALGWRMLGTMGRVEQRPLGAADCVEIVVMVPGPPRDFWREMPSGNAPVPPDRLH